MQSVTSNAVASALPKIIYKEVSIQFWSDYSFLLYPSDVGLTTFKNMTIYISATSWNVVADIQEKKESYIRIRAWIISGVTNATVTVISSGNLNIAFNAI